MEGKLRMNDGQTCKIVKYVWILARRFGQASVLQGTRSLLILAIVDTIDPDFFIGSTVWTKMSFQGRFEALEQT